jgi:Arm DNA-binding domain
MYNDGAGLYLQVIGNGTTDVAKSWIYRYMPRGREREMGLAPLDALSLADARIKAAECRRLKLEGIDPIEARRAEGAKAALKSAKLLSFADCAENTSPCIAMVGAIRSTLPSGVDAQGLSGPFRCGTSTRLW